MECMFINHFYVCIFITKLCFFLLLNKVTCLFKLRKPIPATPCIISCLRIGRYMILRGEYILSNAKIHNSQYIYNTYKYNLKSLLKEHNKNTINYKILQYIWNKDSGCHLKQVSI